MNLLFDERVSAGGREVNTTTVMATITALLLLLLMTMMKIPHSLEMREISGRERRTTKRRWRKQFEEMRKEGE